MKKITRAKLRGKPLEKECYRANTEVFENKVYCLGLSANFADTEIGDIDPKCLQCKAFTNYDNTNNWFKVAGIIALNQRNKEN